jgi:hypothetical protein
MVARLLSLLWLAALGHAKVWDFEVDVGGLAEDDALDTAWKNGGLFNETLKNMVAGDTLVSYKHLWGSPQ